MELLEKKYSPRGILFISVFPGESVAIAEDFKRHYPGASLAVLDEGYSCKNRFDARGWPTYILVNRAGKVVEHGAGLRKNLRFFRKALDAMALPEGEDCPGRTHVARARKRAASTRETSPRICIGPNGLPWVVFESRKDHRSEIRIRGAGEDRVVSSAGQEAYAPDIAADSRGGAWITWSGRSGRRYDIFARRFDGKSFSKIHQVTRSKDDAMRPAAAVDGAGRVWVTYYKWNRDFGTSRDRDVFTRWYDGKAWSEEMQVSPADPAIEDHTDPAIVADPMKKNRVWIAWSWDYHSRLEGNDYEVDQPTIFARAMEAGGGAGKPHLLRSPGMLSHSIDLRPELAASPDGRIWCVHDAWDRTGRAVVVSAGGEGGFAGLHSRPVPAEIFSVPSLAVGPKDTGVVVWMEPAGDHRHLRASIRKGKDWVKKTDLLPEGVECRLPRLAADAEGNVWLAFECLENGQTRVRLKRLTL